MKSLPLHKYECSGYSSSVWFADQECLRFGTKIQTHQTPLAQSGFQPALDNMPLELPPVVHHFRFQLQMTLRNCSPGLCRSGCSDLALWTVLCPYCTACHACCFCFTSCCCTQWINNVVCNYWVQFLVFLCQVNSAVSQTLTSDIIISTRTKEVTQRKKKKKKKKRFRFRFFIQILYSYFLFGFFVQNLYSDSLFRFIIQIHYSDSLFRCIIRIHYSDSLFRSVSQILYLFRFFVYSESLFRSFIQILYSYSLFWFFIQIHYSDSLFRFFIH